VRHLVASGALRPGDPLPSVRDLAREQRINPNTVAKAYQRLAEAGVLESRRGEGTFVAERPPAMPQAQPHAARALPTPRSP
jgi:GntR family transcriptional regulator